MLHYIFLVCLLAFLLPTFTAIPGVPGNQLFFIASILAAFFFNTFVFLRSNFLIVIFIVAFHTVYQSLNLYNEDSTRKLTDFILPVLVSNVFFDYYKIRPDKLKIFIKTFLFALFLTSITTIIALQTYPEASRLLAGRLAEEGKTEEARFYMLLGIGNYVFTIIWAFISLILLNRLSQNEFQIFNKIIYIVFLFSYVLALITASYTTPFLIFILGIFLLKYRESFSNYKKLISISVFSIIGYYIASNLLIFGLYTFANFLNLPNISSRIENIAMRLDGTIEETGFEITNDNELSKDNVYLGAYEYRAIMSFKAFLQSPVTGGNKVGGHNFFIDMLGLYGTLGFSLIVYIFYHQFSKSIRLINNSEGKILYRFIFVLFLFLGVIKTYILLPFFFLFFFVIPLFINFISFNHPASLKSK